MKKVGIEKALFQNKLASVDPAGSACVTEEKLASLREGEEICWKGGGASGAIYKNLDIHGKKSNLKLRSTEAIKMEHMKGKGCKLKVRNGATTTVIHVHSPQGKNYNTLDKFIDALTTSYENVIEQFLKTDKATLALCPISGGLYAGEYINEKFDKRDLAGHLDPSITL